MAKVTLADRLKLKMPKQPHQASQPISSVPAPGQQPAAQNPSAPKPAKAASAAKVPGVNAKTDGNNSAETFSNTPEAPKGGRPMKEPKQALQKALTDAQKHKIMTEVNQNLGVRNLASNDPALQQTGREQQAKYGKPGDAPPPMPTAVTQVKKPTPAPSPNSEKKTVVERKRGNETAPLTIGSLKTAELESVKTPTGTNVLQTDSNKTGTSGALPAKPTPKKTGGSLITPEKRQQMASINAELGYKHLKSPDPAVKQMGRQMLSQLPLGVKAKHRGQQIIGALKSAIAKNEKFLEDLSKNEDTVPDPKPATPSVKPKKKKDPYKPKVVVTQAYKNPARFDAGKFIMGVLGSGSPIANRVLGAAKAAVAKSHPNTLEKLSKSEENQHIKMLQKVKEGSIDAASLVKLLKKC